MKKILLVLCLCLAISSVAAATPLTDYSLGKTQIDLGLGWASDGTSGVNGDINAHPVEWAINQQFGSGSGGVGNLGVTVGLSSNMALRLKTLMFNGSTYNSPQLPDGSGFTATGYVSDTEFDFMYQALTLDRCPVSLTVLIGFDVPVLGTIFSSNNWDNYYGGYTSGNIAQFSLIGGGFVGGLQLVTPINDTTNFYANGDLGTSHWGLGVGVGFALAPQFDFNIGVDYRSFNLNSINSNLNGSITSTQPTIGISYRF